jgi:hypothetical protein
MRFSTGQQVNMNGVQVIIAGEYAAHDGQAYRVRVIDPASKHHGTTQRLTAYESRVLIDAASQNPTHPVVEAAERLPWMLDPNTTLYLAGEAKVQGKRSGYSGWLEVFCEACQSASCDHAGSVRHHMEQAGV